MWLVYFMVQINTIHALIAIMWKEMKTKRFDALVETFFTCNMFPSVAIPHTKTYIFLICPFSNFHAHLSLAGGLSNALPTVS
uniref:Putative secreted protein n=1 Tax=Anopheles darlingi TaxID=43151 RepID=A0A2M4DNQ2_ANODA